MFLNLKFFNYYYSKFFFMNIVFYNLFLCASLHCFCNSSFRKNINKELPLLAFSVIRINQDHSNFTFTLAQKTGNFYVSNLINREQFLSPFFFEKPSPSPFTFKPVDLSSFQQPLKKKGSLFLSTYQKLLLS